MHMIGISGRCSAEHRSSSGLYPFPFDARARRGCTFRLREQNGMPMVQSPGLGDSRHYAMGVFNSCLRTSVGLRRSGPRAGRSPDEDVLTVFGIAHDNLVLDDYTDDEHDDDPASEDD